MRREAPTRFKPVIGQCFCINGVFAVKSCHLSACQCIISLALLFNQICCLIAFLATILLSCLSLCIRLRLKVVEEQEEGENIHKIHSGDALRVRTTLREHVRRLQMDGGEGCATASD